MNRSSRSLVSQGVWRWADHLPLDDLTHAVSLGEADTPLIDLGDALDIDGIDVLVKCEHLNPTGSFKDRIAALALSLVRERSLAGVVGTSSGNGGAAAAAYAARSGHAAVVLALPSTPPEKLLALRSAGATVRLVDGLGNDPATTLRTAREIQDAADQAGYLPFLTGARYSPEIMCGARTIAYELAAEAAETTHVYAPVGGGGLYASLWRGYRDLGRPAPALVAVQPAGCPTVREALRSRDTTARDELPAVPSTTSVSGLQVATLFDDDVVPAIEQSGGHLVEIDDDAIYEAHATLLRLGVSVEPAGATALAGLLADRDAGRLPAGARVVLVATGAGWKDRAAVERTVTVEPVRRLDESIEDLLASVSTTAARLS